jgi:hypothetical protein
MTLLVMTAPGTGPAGAARRLRARVQAMSLLGEIAPVWVSEDQAEPFAHVLGAALTTEFALDTVGGPR